ncbi:MAG TPA: hypothetical protein VK894_06905 [Jiangellales bacterium]|nr:hypothetical protein [Jiangellales bacterium]
MTTSGPLQVLVVGFEGDPLQVGRVRQELHRLRAHGVLRLVDALVLRREADGGFTTEQLEGDAGDAERERAGLLVRRLLGLGAGVAPESAGLAGPTKPAGPAGPTKPAGPAGPDAWRRVVGSPAVPGAADEDPSQDAAEGLTAGLGPEDIRRLAASIAPGVAVAVVLVEHTWAARLRAGARQAGGRLLLQGILTRPAVLALGQELAAVIEASEAAELAAASAGAAMARALAAEGNSAGHDNSALEQAADDHAREMAAERTSASGETLRVLMERGLLPRSAGPAAVHALLEEGVIDSRSAAEAVAAGQSVDRDA